MHSSGSDGLQDVASKGVHDCGWPGLHSSEPAVGRPEMCGAWLGLLLSHATLPGR